MNLDPAVHKQVMETVWDNFYRLGGPGMYLTTLFGLGLLVVSVLYLIRRDEKYVPMAKTLSLLTLASGVLGTTTGLMVAFRFVQHMQPADQVAVAALGFAEAINNIVLALLLTIASGLVVLGAQLRKNPR